MVVIFGSRQVGKTTLVKWLQKQIDKSTLYIDLELDAGSLLIWLFGAFIEKSFEINYLIYWKFLSIGDIINATLGNDYHSKLFKIGNVQYTHFGLGISKIIKSKKIWLKNEYFLRVAQGKQEST